MGRLGWLGRAGLAAMCISAGGCSTVVDDHYRAADLGGFDVAPEQLASLVAARPEPAQAGLPETLAVCRVQAPGNRASRRAIPELLGGGRFSVACEERAFMDDPPTFAGRLASMPGSPKIVAPPAFFFGAETEFAGPDPILKAAGDAGCPLLLVYTADAHARQTTIFPLNSISLLFIGYLPCLINEGSCTATAVLIRVRDGRAIAAWRANGSGAAFHTPWHLGQPYQMSIDAESDALRELLRQIQSAWPKLFAASPRR